MKKPCKNFLPLASLSIILILIFVLIFVLINRLRKETFFFAPQYDCEEALNKDQCCKNFLHRQSDYNFSKFLPNTDMCELSKTCSEEGGEGDPAVAPGDPVVKEGYTSQQINTLIDTIDTIDVEVNSATIEGKKSVLTMPVSKEDGEKWGQYFTYYWDSEEPNDKKSGLLTLEEIENFPLNKPGKAPSGGTQTDTYFAENSGFGEDLLTEIVKLLEESNSSEYGYTYKQMMTNADDPNVQQGDFAFDALGIIKFTTDNFNNIDSDTDGIISLTDWFEASIADGGGGKPGGPGGVSLKQQKQEMWTKYETTKTNGQRIIKGRII